MPREDAPSGLIGMRPLGSGHLGNLLRDPYLLMNERVQAALAEAGFSDLTFAHTQMATHISDEGSRITELAQRAQLTKPSVVYLVDELQRLGYVERVPDPTDRRAKLVRPTARGLDAQELGRTTVRSIEREWRKLLGKKRMKALQSGLRDLHAALWPAPDSNDS